MFDNKISHFLSIHWAFSMFLASTVKCSRVFDIWWLLSCNWKGDICKNYSYIYSMWLAVIYIYIYWCVLKHHELPERHIFTLDQHPLPWLGWPGSQKTAFDFGRGSFTSLSPGQQPPRFGPYRFPPNSVQLPLLTSTNTCLINYNDAKYRLEI